jgi:hypothetical protein
MALKLILDKLDGLSDEIKAQYKAGADGKFHLDTDEDPALKAKISEFRDNNIALKKEIDEFKEKYKNVDPTKHAEMAAKLQQLEDKKMIELGKLDELVAQKTERMRAEYENQIKAMKEALEGKDTELKKTGNRLSEVLIDSEITKAVTGIGVRKDAMVDILARGRLTWSLDEAGKPVPKLGDKILYGKDGKAAMTFEEWAKVLSETAPHLFEASGGGGAKGNQGGGAQKPVGNLANLPPGERLRVLHGDGQTNVAQK